MQIAASSFGTFTGCFLRFQCTDALMQIALALFSLALACGCADCPSMFFAKFHLSLRDRVTVENC
jgi:hypothetical protein